ncbi:DUF397 domain-containing protein [Streptomyces sp. NPDC002088]|uniref:DUF397 domain-containing protein n=1 Tax=unclassified Streptomyces TaxID=2593676 RepID=UPI0033191E20
MSELHWQKSTYSGGPQGDCVYLATAPTGTIHLRESDRPRTVLSTTPASLSALLDHLKAPTRGTTRS